MPKVTPGDVVEVRVSGGYGYVQKVLDHKGSPSYGELVRVFAGRHKKRPNDLIALAAGEEQFVTFLPLSVLVKRGEMAVVGNAPIPKGKRKLPRFKCHGAMNPTTGHTEIWWEWDGSRAETRIGPVLTDEQAGFSTSGIINLPLLIERIESGYRPADDWVESERRRTTPAAGAKPPKAKKKT